MGANHKIDDPVVLYPFEVDSIVIPLFTKTRALSILKSGKCENCNEREFASRDTSKNTDCMIEDPVVVPPNPMLISSRSLLHMGRSLLHIGEKTFKSVNMPHP